MYCRYCGKELPEDAVFCPACGKKTERDGEPFSEYTEGGGRAADARPARTAPYARPDDTPNAGWAVLGFFFPLVGLILYLVWEREMPNRARMCGKGALIAVIVYAVLAALGVLLFVVIAVIAAAGAGM